MQRWILTIILLITTLTAVALVVALRQKPSSVPAETDWQQTESGVKIYAPSSGSNSAAVATDPTTGTKILAARAGLEGFRIPEFSLVNQNGEPVNHTILEGKITILDFIFTNCVTACPPMTGNMLQVVKELEGTPVQFVSISVDPVRDTPEQLAAYADRFGIDTSRWMFLTGDEGEASRVVNESLQFEISTDPDESSVIPLADGSTMSNILHPIKFFLIGPNREILDFCSPTVPADRDRLTALAREAAG